MLYFLAMMACAQETDTDGWTQSFVRQQDIIMPYTNTGRGLRPGWIVTEVPLEMLREAVGAEPLDACLQGLEPGGHCEVTIGVCMSFTVLRLEEPEQWENVLSIWPEGCKQASDTLGVRWHRTLTNPGQSKRWTPPGALEPGTDRVPQQQP